jgi:hypothetical protein
MKRLLLTTSAITALAFLPILGEQARADVILAFGQSGGGSTVTGSVASNVTTISATTGVTVTSYAAGGTPFAATLAETMSSTGAISCGACTAGSFFSQAYSGSFSITNGATNFLSGGSFVGTVSGTLGQTGISFATSSNPVFTSTVLAPSALTFPTAIGFTFTNVLPASTVDGLTLAAFTSSISGNMSSSFTAPPPPPPPPPPSPTPEPATLALLGAGLAGLGAVRRRRKV